MTDMFLADVLYADLSLRAVSILLGVIYLVTHGFAAVQSEAFTAWLKKFPRDTTAAHILLAVCVLWTLWLLWTLDIGNFHSWRIPLLVAAPAVYFLLTRFAPQFLAVRLLGCLLLLAAAPVLQACFLRPEKARLILVVMAYAWVVAGMFLVGKPYLLRDLIDAIVSRKWLVPLAYAGAVYGILLIVLGAFFF
ncbi:hypothetical protein QQ056_13915 [Oscillatoria laete-virens NRMC-F 0139]|nr:hypothetical protein [Oscillatoria laete-virens]MDL5054634.1 hypothetical protein [Oscillatoria laete-virens NRMC-F 0139]